VFLNLQTPLLPLSKLEALDDADLTPLMRKRLFKLTARQKIKTENARTAKK
jgi:hypothetical protein